MVASIRRTITLINVLPWESQLYRSTSGPAETHAVTVDNTHVIVRAKWIFFLDTNNPLFLKYCAWNCVEIEVSFSKYGVVTYSSLDLYQICSFCFAEGYCRSMFLCACTSGFSLAKGTGTERTGNKFLLLFYATKDMHNGRMFFINVENEWVLFSKRWQTRENQWMLYFVHLMFIVVIVI